MRQIFKLQYFKKVILISLGWLFIGITSFYLLPLPSRLNASHSPLLMYHNGEVAHIFLSDDEKWRSQVHLENVDPNYITALLTIEDKRFFQHTGFDPISITRAFIQNLQAGTVISGASTLTMQLVRLLEPRERTYASKIVETWRAMQLEWFLSKNELLEAYLTFIPFGKNIEGLEAASLAYFGHLPQYLEADQIALLIAVPQNPNGRYPTGANAQRLEQARNHILQLLHSKDALPLAKDENFEQILAKPIPTALQNFPREAPHLAYQLKPWIPKNGRLKTTLDPIIQQKIQNILLERKKLYNSQNIYNAGIIVTDHSTGEIRGIVGNFDYWSDDDGAQIPSYSALRSGASTLKPFLYAYAIDMGLATPARKMEDIPKNFKGYRPRNYGQTYHGLVSLSEALSQSYNVPFVEILEEIGLDPFLQLLQKLGATQFMQYRDRLGLSVAVGLELSPLELTQLYLTFPNFGISKTLHIIDSTTINAKSIEEQMHLISPQEGEHLSSASTWLTTQALSKRDRPDFPERGTYAYKSRPLAWKTGTSFGFHDAWTVGWGKEYLTTVWFGNLNYNSSMYLIGSQTAGTVFFDIMEQIEEPFSAEPAPQDVIPFAVCSYSGHPPNAFCPEIEETFARKERVPTRKCENHHRIYIDLDSGERVSPQCQMNNTKNEIVLIPSVQYTRWSKIPNHLPNIAQQCQGSGIASNISIQSPDDSRRILLMQNVDNQQIPLIANYLDSQAILYWYIDDAYLGKSSSNETLWWTPTQGQHTIAVEDGKGHSHQVVIAVDDFATVVP